SALSSAYGRTRAILVSEVALACTCVITPTGTPGTYGRPWTEPNVTSCCPGWSTAPASKTGSRSRVGPGRDRPVPVTAAGCPGPASRPPTVDDASELSSTVDVRAATEVTVPTSPAPFSTVSSGLMPSSRPASMVTELLYPGLAAITFAATIR